jgi:predicted permease
MGRFLRKLRWMFVRDVRERELREELEFHLAEEAEERQAAGLTGNRASVAARQDLGNLTRVVEDTRAEWGWPVLEEVGQDLRYASRTLRRSPGVTAIAAGSSALGIGACAVMFAVLNAAILKPLPVDDPGRLVSLSDSDPRSGQVGDVLSYLDYLDLRDARSFEGVAAYDDLVSASVGAADDPERQWGALVTANYFSVVKPRFAWGRGFDTARDDTAGEARVIVLSHDLWRRRFGSDPNIIGQNIMVNNRPAAVVGVTAPGFVGTDVGRTLEFWIPWSMLDEIESRLGPISENRRRFWLRAVGRLRAETNLQAARSEIDVVAATLNTTVRRDNERRGFHLEAAGRIEPPLRAMAMSWFGVSTAVTVLVLIAACANVATLLLGRGAMRRREIAARMALGASRARVLRQLLTESLLLALIGGAGGLMVAAYVSPVFGFLRIPLGSPLDVSITLDDRVLLFCVALSLVTGALFGIVPALKCTKSDPLTGLKAGVSDDPSRVLLRNGLVVTQVAVCTVLLLGMGLFLRSLQTTREMDLGLSNRNLLLLSFDPALDHRPDVQIRPFLGNLLEQVRGVAGVESATLTTAVPLTLVISNSNFIAAEKAKDPQAPRTRTDIYGIGPDFFTTFGIAFLEGEDFHFGGGPGAGTAIVNEAFARAAFPGQSPIGRRVVGDGKSLVIAGRVATAKSRTIGEDPRPAIYLPLLPAYAAAEAPRGMTLAVRTANPAATYTRPLREVIRRADPTLAVFDVRTMERHVSDAMLVPRLMSGLSAVAGGVGLAIAVVGVYGVVSVAAARRRREVGVRLAVGARPREIIWLMLTEGITLALLGIAIGLVAALGLARFVASLLYGVHSVDPSTFLIAPSGLAIVALIASMVPALAAARVNPVEVLRSE